MRQLEVIFNDTQGEMQETHILDIPPCCPVSKNPRASSQVSISYTPRGRSLEIAFLAAYIHSFKGGLRNDLGEIEVRDMEAMIQRIADDCAGTLRQSVVVEAHLNLLPQQVMKLRVKRTFGSED